MMDKTFKEKLALARGKRVKLTRTLANLTRKELFKKHKVNPNTIRAWEEGSNLLTEPKAINLVKIFNQEGIDITLEWLLYGEDLNLTNKPKLDNKNQSLKDIINICGDLKIFDEINYFKQNNLNSISSIVDDESLFPAFCAGDYVGGINSVGKRINELVGEFCIITTTEEKTFIKKIFNHKEENFFLIGGINPFYKSNELYCFTCEILSAAKITRHWRTGMIGG